MNKARFVFIVLSFLCFVLFGQKTISDIPRGKPFLIRPEGVSSSAARNGSSLKSILQLGSEDDLRLVSEKTDRQGFKQQKYQQYHNGIPVEYGTVNISTSRGTINAISGEMYDIPSHQKPSPSITERAALEAAMKHIGARQYNWETDEMAMKRAKTGYLQGSPKGTLVYVKVFLPNGDRKVGDMVLAYKFDIHAKQPLSRDYIYVDAYYGTVIHKNAIIKHASEGTAHTRYSGVKSISTTFDASINKYVLKDDSRGHGIETYNMNSGSNYETATNFIDNDNNWTTSEFDNAAKDNIALDAHWGAQKTYDYFLEKHGRNSFDDNGAKIKSYVHYGTDFANAFWDGSVMTYGDGDSEIDPLTSLDICAHEIGHAVCSNTADLVYAYEPGALNESLSDIWGATIEHYAAPEKSTWELGEDANFIIRSLSDPNVHQQPDTYQGDYWYYGGADNGGVHYNSGVMNHWYYILVMGKSGVNDHNVGYDVQGIGFDAAASIVYRMESVYLTPNSQYSDARDASIYAAIDLFGESSNEVKQTRKAWSAVGLYETIHAPSNLIATVTSPTTVSLTWKDNAPNETSFILERSTSFNTGFEIIKIFEPNTTSFIDTNVPGGIHYYRIRAVVDDNSTESSNKVTASMGETPLVMAETQVSTCNRIFVDHGGFENYTGDKEINMVILPDQPGKKVKVSFSSFSLSKSDHWFDGLLVYDGVDINAPQLGVFTMSTIPPDLVATNASGALTFHFISYDETNGFGWQANLTCEVMPPPPENLVAEVSGTQVNLSWTDVSNIETGFRIERKNSSEFAEFEHIATVANKTTIYTDIVQEQDRYTYRIFSLYGDLLSASSNTAHAIIGTPFIMTDGEYTVCGSQFLDPGGYEYYPIEKHTITTLAPTEPGTSIVISIDEFNVESFFDYLEIYDGGSVNAPYLAWLSGQLITSPAVFYPQNPEGKLTLLFHSDEIIGAYGWKGNIKCVSQPKTPTNLAVEIKENHTHLTWVDNATDETGYIIERATGEIFTTLGIVNANVIAYNDETIEENREYKYRIRAIKEEDGAKIFSPYSNTGSALFGNPPAHMTHGEITACNNSFFDSGIDSDYGNNENHILTIAPENPGEKVMINFTFFDLEDGYDSLWIYNGADISAPLLGAYTGKNLPPSASASNEEGKLTFRFVSDIFVTAGGWKANISCGAPLIAPTNLVAEATGNNSINLEWNDLESSETGYVVERSSGNVFTVIANLNDNVTTFEDTQVQSNRKYQYRVRAIRNGVTSHSSNTVSVELGSAPIIMHNGSVTACNSVFLDPGGDDHHGYGTQILTIGPDQPGNQVTVTFTMFELGEWYTPDNYLEVFNGTGTQAENSLGKVSPENLIFYSGNAQGTLTFKFSAVPTEKVKAGWEANITCSTKSKPIIKLEDRQENYFDFGVSYYRGYSYKDASFTYTIVDDGSNTGGLRLDPVPEPNWIGLFTLKPGKVKVKASIPETQYYEATEKIATITIVKRQPYIILSNVDASISSSSVTLNARDYYNNNFNFKYEIVEDRNNTGEVELSGQGNKVVSFIQAGTVKIRCFLEENEFYKAAEKIITVTIRKNFSSITFPDITATYGNVPFDLNATSYQDASIQYHVIENNEIVSLSGAGNRTATIQAAGEAKIQAFVGESVNYYAVGKINTLTIGKASQAIDFPSISNKLNVDPPFELAASSSSGLPIEYAIEYGPAIVSGNMLELTGGTGIVSVIASQEGNNNFHAAESHTRKFLVDLTLSTDDPVLTSIHVWPNPTNSGILHVESDFLEIHGISLTDLTGRPVFASEKVSMKNDLMIGNLSSGIYILNIKVENNRVTTRKVQIAN